MSCDCQKREEEIREKQVKLFVESLAPWEKALASLTICIFPFLFIALCVFLTGD